MSRATDLAWLAGFFDGEGSIGAFWSKNGRQVKKPVLRILVQAGVTHEPTMNRTNAIASDLLGREIRHVKKRDFRGFRPLYRWRLYTHADVKVLLIALLPYLVTKRRQAELVLRLLELAPGRGGNYRTPWTDEHHKILAELSDLNRRYSPSEWAARL